MAKRRNQDLLENKLLDMSVPTVAMKAHQMQLKQALFAASRSSKNIANIKVGWRKTFSGKRVMLSGATVSVLIVAIIAFSMYGLNSPEAQAQKLTKQSITALSKLSPSQMTALEKSAHIDNPMTDLTNAEHAKDLTYLTYDQFLKQVPQVGTSTVSASANASFASGPSTANLKNLKFLRYTDSQGMTHIIGINSSGLPIIEIGIGNSQSGHTITSGMMQESSNAVPVAGQILNSSSNQSGRTSCVSAANGTVSCSNSVPGSQPTITSSNPN